MKWAVDEALAIFDENIDALRKLRDIAYDDSKQGFPERYSDFLEYHRDMQKLKAERAKILAPYKEVTPHDG